MTKLITTIGLTLIFGLTYGQDNARTMNGNYIWNGVQYYKSGHFIDSSLVPDYAAQSYWRLDSTGLAATGYYQLVFDSIPDGNVNGNGDTNQVAFWGEGDTISGSNDFTYRSANRTLRLNNANSFFINEGRSILQQRLFLGSAAITPYNGEFLGIDTTGLAANGYGTVITRFASDLKYSGTTNRVAFYGAADSLGEDALFTYNPTTDKLSLGSTSISNPLAVQSSVGGTGIELNTISFVQQNNGDDVVFRNEFSLFNNITEEVLGVTGTGAATVISFNPAAAADIHMETASSDTTFTVDYSARSVGINNSTPASLLHIEALVGTSAAIRIDGNAVSPAGGSPATINPPTGFATEAQFFRVNIDGQEGVIAFFPEP